MGKLTADFTSEKYGLKVRLVNEDDAIFILSLRTDPNRTKFMLTLKDEIESQKEWIKEYKKREAEGLDYYFIYTNLEDKPLGINRASYVNINTKTCKASSWIATKGLQYEPLKMLLLGNEIVFNMLGITTIRGEVHKMNKRAIRIFKLFGYILKDVGTEYYHFSLIKDDFLEACENSILSRIKANNKYYQ